MDPNTRTGWTLGAQLNMLVLVATLVPAVAILGLSFWSIGQIASTTGSSNRDDALGRRADYRGADRSGSRAFDACACAR